SRCSPTSRASRRRPARRWATLARSCRARRAPRRRRRRHSRRRACAWAATRRRCRSSRSRSSARGCSAAAIVAAPMAELTNISLARGAPSLDIIAVDDLRASAQAAFERDPAGTFAYGTSAGYPRLLEWIAAKHDVSPDCIVATNGSMQADAFLFQKLVEPGDLVVVEAPTYDRTLLALRQLGAQILAIPLEADGIEVDALEVALREGARPTLAHIIPNFQNPAGCTLSLE